MKARVAKKVVKNQDKLKYRKGTIRKAEVVINRNKKDSE